jgi:Sulfite exporter TauE/SafE
METFSALRVALASRIARYSCDAPMDAYSIKRLYFPVNLPSTAAKRVRDLRIGSRKCALRRCCVPPWTPFTMPYWSTAAIPWLDRRRRHLCLRAVPSAALAVIIGAKRRCARWNGLTGNQCPFA